MSSESGLQHLQELLEGDIGRWASTMGADETFEDSKTEFDGDKKPVESYNTGQLEPGEDDNLSPIEQVNLNFPITDDPSLPVLTFRCWVLGILSCVALSFFNQFFSCRAEPLTVSPLTAQIESMPLGKLMAAVLPTKRFLKGSRF